MFLRKSRFSATVKRLLYALTFFFCINSAFAQSTANYNAKPGTKAIVYLNIPYSMFNQKTMKPQGVGDGFGWFALGFDVIFYDYFLLGTEFGYDNPADKASFTNNTTAGEMTSHVSVFEYTLLGGLKSPDLYFSTSSPSRVFANLNAGYMWAFLEKRSIENCNGCDREDLNINGGLLLNPEIYYVFDVFALGLGYKHFFNSDFDAKIELKISGVFR